MNVDPKALEILHFPAPALRARAAPIEAVDERVRAISKRMFQVMREVEGIGLAAPQVGVPWRLFITEAREGFPERVYINPLLSDFDRDLIVAEEGCLSLPGLTADVRRPKSVTITAIDLEGHPFTLRDDGLFARVWQHEYDHLDGVLIIDKMTPMERLANRRAIRDLKSAAGR
jgi:peptide deformylase